MAFVNGKRDKKQMKNVLKWKINGEILPKICKFENNCGDSGLKTLIAYVKM